MKLFFHILLRAGKLFHSKVPLVSPFGTSANDIAVQSREEQKLNFAALYELNFSTLASASDAENTKIINW